MVCREFFLYHRAVKAVIKFDKLNRCKYVDDTLKSQLAKFWNSVS